MSAEVEAGAGAILQYYQYLSSTGSTVYTTRYFCGGCRQEVATPYAFPRVPEDLEAENESNLSLPQAPDRQLSYYAFCPWCGVHLAGEWWKDRTIQNERVIDHYQNPGTHKGDRNLLPVGFVEGHWLASSGHELCWCDPVIEPGIMGCTIRHQPKRYEDVMALRREMEDDDEWEDDADQ